jgi:hypothetical protein
MSPAPITSTQAEHTCWDIKYLVSSRPLCPNTLEPWHEYTYPLALDFHFCDVCSSGVHVSKLQKIVNKNWIIKNVYKITAIHECILHILCYINQKWTFVFILPFSNVMVKFVPELDSWQLLFIRCISQIGRVTNSAKTTFIIFFLLWGRFSRALFLMNETKNPPLILKTFLN